MYGPVGVVDGTGDKLILAAGTNNPSGTYPYSLGINTNTLFYSVPSGASHKINSYRTNTLIIDSSGKINIGSQTSNNILQVGDGARLRISNSESAISRGGVHRRGFLPGTFGWTGTGR